MVPYFGQKKKLKAENSNLPGILGYDVRALAESTSHVMNFNPGCGTYKNNEIMKMIQMVVLTAAGALLKHSAQEHY